MNSIEHAHGLHSIGFEPFDRYKFVNDTRYFDLSKKDLYRCLKYLFSRKQADSMKLLKVMQRYGQNNINCDASLAQCIKMRITSCHHEAIRWKYRKVILKILKETETVLFCLERRDSLAQAVSRYKGVGLQFKKRRGELTPGDMEKIVLEKQRFDELFTENKTHSRQNHILFEEAKKKNVDACVIYYEDFLNNPRVFFTEIFNKINKPIVDSELDFLLNRENHFEKVHSRLLRDVVENYDELTSWYPEEVQRHEQLAGC